MKLFISLFTIFNSSFLLLAQTAVQSGSGTAPAGQAPARFVPAQTAPVQTSPFAAPASTGGGSVLSSGSAFQRPLGRVQGVFAVEAAAPQVDAGVGVQTPAGVEVLNPVLPPPTESLPPPIRSGLSQPLGAEIVDPSGAASGDAVIQRGGTSGTGTFTTDAQSQAQSGIAAQQFQSITAGEGTTQVAFPQQNSVVTIVSRNGNLILQGAVSSEQDRQNVEQAIRQISSTGFVDNQLQVVPVSNSTAE